MTSEEIVRRTNHIPSSVHAEEQRMWLDIISKIDKPLIVDFGTGWGKSASSLAMSNPKGKVFTFDLGEVHINGGRSKKQYIKEVKKYLEVAGVKNVDFEVISSLKKKWDKPIDVLNIDSDHQYETTKEEMKKWIPFVKKGGIVFFHDYEHPRCPGVRQAIDELVPSKYNLKFQYVTQAGEVKCAYFIKE